MKMIVPAKGKNNTYQVTILADNLSKEELEKIMLFLFKIKIESQDPIPETLFFILV